MILHHTSYSHYYKKKKKTIYFKFIKEMVNPVNIID